MTEAKQRLVKSWLTKAQRDLSTARRLSDDSDPYLDTAIYHCQQAAEKAVKAVLVFHDHRFDKTHDIRALVSLAMGFAPQFSEWLDVGGSLTPYATTYRYPGESLEPTREEFDQAMKSAEDFYAFVLSILPPEVHPLITKPSKSSDQN
jgi:HEPN domain-containing protein